MDFGSGSLQMLAEFRIELGDSKAGDSLVLGLCVLFQSSDEFLPLHIVEGNIDIVGFLAHDLDRCGGTLSRTHPPATRMTVVSPS